MDKTEIFGMDFSTFVRLIDNLHDEIIIYDNNYRMLYVNKACERHYGFTQAEMIGLPFWEVVKKHRAWDRSVLPAVYKYKCPVKQEQKTYLGLDILSIATPVLDPNGNVEYVLFSIRDNYHEGKIPCRDELTTEQDVIENAPPSDLVYHSRLMEIAVESARKVADISSPCLLLGESGCGKSLLAKYIHSTGKRAEKPFVVVNCAAIPQHLFESELFGHVRGAFSGAVQKRGGLFAKAEGGTLFLDEISELPLSMQPKILHAVQEREYRPVGSSQTVTANVRILAASNKNLEHMVHSGAFRQDLFFRLNVFDILIPPLRERRRDIVPLLSHFLNRFGKQHGRSCRLSSDAQTLLCQYSWPGNIRELAHLVERLVVTVDAEVITVDHLPASIYATSAQAVSSVMGGGALDESLAAMERKLVLDAHAIHGSTRKVAASLGISQTRASRLIKKYASRLK
ncbi:AAA domain-containing protein [Desulfovibrio sulfodismutans]|uniref:HTH-type transcriptional regulatory protein TyrR n=1 Tax=Desulfolutivibrio sulfodismutans TaxID=63561 RepID=A0A7K3NI10_9BACT|nr:sigma 54-interacting transcriptional regulator [Desulfolutivibrio sulfodismutans]NDY55425.1 AAA domain-containing protein [Desulfolutivibrio sulfodismutans]